MSSDYVMLARCQGVSTFKLITRYILPNSIMPVITIIAMLLVSLMTGSLVIKQMFSIPSAIFFETFLSFVGLGMPIGSCSLGTLLPDGFANVLIHPYKLLPPAIVMITLMVSCHLIARGLEKIVTGRDT